jgi:uncharacterized protein (DUF3820 family)
MSELTRSIARGAHGAESDVIMCFDVLRALLRCDAQHCTAAGHALHAPASSGAALHRHDAMRTIYELSEGARVPKRMPFGKHKGKPIADVDAGYRGWLLSQGDVDVYLRRAFEEIPFEGVMETMPFGKHRGKPIAEVPESYRDWLRSQGSVREDLLAAFERCPAAV